MFFSSHRYYFAWKLGESICYAGAFGFTGWSADGTEQWDLIKNCAMVKLEVLNLIIFRIFSQNLAPPPGLSLLLYSPRLFSQLIYPPTSSACNLLYIPAIHTITHSYLTGAHKGHWGGGGGGGGCTSVTYTSFVLINSRRHLLSRLLLRSYFFPIQRIWIVLGRCLFF